MKKSNFNYNKEYYNSGTRSRYSSRSRSSKRLQSEWGGQSSTSSRNRFYHRIQKACTTFSSNDLNKEIYLCRKQVQRLEKQLLKKDKVIFELKQFNMQNKQVEVQLVEVYRVLYLYQGKIVQYEKELKKMELAMASRVSKDITVQVEELLESYRVDNGQLSAQLEEKSRIIMDLQIKLKKLENKYFSTAWKLSSTKRQITNPLKKRFPQLRNTITFNETPLLQKQKDLKTQTAKGKNFDISNEYQIVTNNVAMKEKPPLNFKKVQASNHQENRTLQYSPYKDIDRPIGGGGPKNINSKPSNQPFSFINNSASQNINQSSQKVLRYATSSFNPVSHESNIPRPSNPNISSQMTVSMSGNVRRVDYREGRSQSPRPQLRASTINMHSYGIAKDLNDVNTMVKNVERRVSYTPVRGTSTTTGQSIYLN